MAFDQLNTSKIEGGLRRVWRNAGTPTSGTSGTYAGSADPGDLCIDTTNAILYINTNTAASPTWTEVLDMSTATISGNKTFSGDITFSGDVALPASVVDKADLAAEVAISISLVVGPGLFDNETIELGPVRDACTLVHVTYDTDASPGLGTGVGIDILDGSTDGSGADVIDSCSDNLSGLDSNALSTPYALSAGDYLRVKFDDFAASTYMTTVTIWLKVPLRTVT